ncbi:MAG TPA: hypothetical protein VJR29_11830 [bacterium]|nr:hypothetical protein [bacterium]
MLQFLLPIVGLGAIFLSGCSNEKPDAQKPEHDSKPKRPRVGDEVKALPLQAHKLGDYFVSDENGDKQLDSGDLIFRKNAAKRSYSVLDQNSAEIRAFMKGLGHCPERPLRFDGGVYAYLEVTELPNVKLTAFVAESAPSLLISEYEIAKEYARANNLEFSGRSHLYYIQQGLQTDYLDFQCPAFPSFKAYLRWGCPPRLDEELENCRTIAAGLKTYAEIDKSSDITRMEAWALYLKEKQAELKIPNRCGSLFGW